MEKGIKKWRTIIDKLNTKESDPMFCYHNFSQAVKGEVPFKLLKKVILLNFILLFLQMTLMLVLRE